MYFLSYIYIFIHTVIWISFICYNSRPFSYFTSPHFGLSLSRFTFPLVPQNTPHPTSRILLSPTTWILLPILFAPSPNHSAQTRPASPRLAPTF